MAEYLCSVICLQGMVEELRRLFDKFVVKILDFIKVNHCTELVPIAELNGIISLCRLFDILATPENGVSIWDFSSGGGNSLNTCVWL